MTEELQGVRKVHDSLGLRESTQGRGLDLLGQGFGHRVAKVYWFSQAGVGLEQLGKQQVTFGGQPLSTDGWGCRGRLSAVGWEPFRAGHPPARGSGFHV